MQDILDSASPITVNVLDESDIDKDSDDEALPATENLNYNLADKELCILEAFKCSKYQPTFVKQDGKALMGTYEGSVKEIFVGPATKRGKDLQSDKNLFDYINKQERMCLVCFFWRPQR
jgi:hypothetical protein